MIDIKMLQHHLYMQREERVIAEHFRVGPAKSTVSFI